MCGAVVNVRAKQFRIALWTRTAANEAVQVALAKQLKEVLQLSDAAKIGYMAHVWREGGEGGLINLAGHEHAGLGNEHNSRTHQNPCAQPTFPDPCHTAVRRHASQPGQGPVHGLSTGPAARRGISIPALACKIGTRIRHRGSGGQGLGSPRCSALSQLQPHAADFRAGSRSMGPGCV